MVWLMPQERHTDGRIKPRCPSSEERVSVVSMATAGQSSVPILTGANDLLSLKSVQICYVAHPASYSIRTEVHSLG